MWGKQAFGIFSRIGSVLRNSKASITNWWKRLPLVRKRLPKVADVSIAGYPERLNPFAKAKGLKYPDHLNPFGKYPEHLNPFFKPSGYSKSLNPFAEVMSSASSVLITLAMLSLLSDGNLVFTGTLPMSEYENATFKCEMKPFKSVESNFIMVGKSKQLFIDGNLIPNGNCQFRKVHLPYLFIDIWDGVIRIGNEKETRFEMHGQLTDQFVETSFTEFVTIQEDYIDILSSFIGYNKDLGSTTNFKFNVSENFTSIELEFAIENIGHFKVEMAAVELFEAGDPFIGSYQFENKEAFFYFILRRQTIAFPLVSHGTINFKKSDCCCICYQWYRNEVSRRNWSNCSTTKQQWQSVCQLLAFNLVLSMLSMVSIKLNSCQ